MKLLLITILFIFTAFAQNFEIVKEKSEGSGMNAKTTVLVKHDNSYYLGTGYGQLPMSKSLAIQNAEWKIKNTPNDTISESKIKHLFR